jgi:hypothetical protein
MRGIVTKPKPVESKRTSRMVQLKDYDDTACTVDFLEVTVWSNGEGFDLHISRGEQYISMTWGESTALQAALGDWIDPPEQDSKPCPYVVSSDEGTSYCKLGVQTADLLAKLTD